MENDFRLWENNYFNFHDLNTYRSCHEYGVFVKLVILSSVIPGFASGEGNGLVYLQA